MNRTIRNLQSHFELEYLVVYGRASMAAFCQLSTRASSQRDARLNKHGQKFDPESLYEPM